MFASPVYILVAVAHYIRKTQMKCLTFEFVKQWRRKQIVSVEAMLYKFFVSFCTCGSGDFFSKVHTSSKAAFFSKNV